MWALLGGLVMGGVSAVMSYFAGEKVKDQAQDQVRDARNGQRAQMIGTIGQTLANATRGMTYLHIANKVADERKKFIENTKSEGQYEVAFDAARDARTARFNGRPVR